MSRMAGDEIRKKFGLDFNEKHSEMDAPGSKYSRSTGGDGYALDNGAIFTEDGEYVGSVNPDGDKDYYSGFSDLTDAATPFKKDAEGKGFSSVNSLSDIAGAVNWLTKSDDTDPEPTDPIDDSQGFVDSQPVAEARAYRDAYDDYILPYQGDYIMGTGRGRKADGSRANISEDFMRAYQLNLLDAGKERNADGSLFNEEDRIASEMRGQQFRNEMDTNQYDPEEESRRVAGMSF